MEFNILILALRPYDYVKKDTGERKTGCAVHYINLDAPLTMREGEHGWMPEEGVIKTTADSKVLGLPVTAVGRFEFREKSMGRERVNVLALTDFVNVQAAGFAPPASVPK